LSYGPAFLGAARGHVALDKHVKIRGLGVRDAESWT